MKMQVWVGGCLPESALDELIEVLKDDDVKLVDGDTPAHDKHQILDFNLPNSIEFEFEPDTDMSTWMPAVDLNLDDFCKAHGLSIKKRTPPCTGPDGEHYNEALSYWLPGMDRFDTIPTNGEGDVSVDQNAVITLFDQLWDLQSKIQVDECPLHINDNDIVIATYAKNVMAGKPFNEIFKELLKSQVGHEEIEIPPFQIIKGK
jgi:hypothetical protein